MAWHLAYELLKPGDWKRLAEHWSFTKEQVFAIEEQWTGEILQQKAAITKMLQVQIPRHVGRLFDH